MQLRKKEYRLYEPNIGLLYLQPDIIGQMIHETHLNTMPGLGKSGKFPMALRTRSILSCIDIFVLMETLC